jgi:hypothetical protein
MPELRRKPPDSWRRGGRLPHRPVGLACQPQRILGHPAPRHGPALRLHRRGTARMVGMRSLRSVAGAGWCVRPGGGPLQRGADLISIDLGDRPLLPLRGLPAALPQPAGHHHPVALGEGVGQVLGLHAPDVDRQERGVAVAPRAVLLNPLGHRHPQVGDGDAARGEAQLGVVDQVADDGGVVVRCHHVCSLLVLIQRSGPVRSGPWGHERVGGGRRGWRRRPGSPGRPAR